MCNACATHGRRTGDTWTSQRVHLNSYFGDNKCHDGTAGAWRDMRCGAVAHTVNCSSSGFGFPGTLLVKGSIFNANGGGGAGAGGIVSDATVTCDVKNVTVLGTNFTNNEGGIAAVHTALTVDKSHFTNNVQNFYGGGAMKKQTIN